MRNKTWTSGFALCLAMSAGSAQAAITEDSFLVRSTGDLIELCSAAPADAMYTAASNFCHGFAVGVYRVLQEQDMARRSNRLFCAPNPTPTRNEAIANFVQWAKADAQRLAQSPADGIAMYLAQQFPCPRNR
jgi:hypothetical protein